MLLVMGWEAPPRPAERTATPYVDARGFVGVAAALGNADGRRDTADLSWKKGKNDCHVATAVFVSYTCSGTYFTDPSQLGEGQGEISVGASCYGRQGSPTRAQTETIAPADGRSPAGVVRIPNTTGTRLPSR